MARVTANRRRLGGALVAGLLFALVVVSLLPSAGVSGTVSSTLNPTDDAYVLQTSPSANFGTSTQLSASTSPITRSYLKFTVPTLSGAVSRATLRVFSTVTSPTGFDVRSAANNWSETQITYSNSPTPSATITGSSGALTAGTWASVDVTSLVTGSGTKTFALTSTATAADLLGSRESANQPQLVVDVNDPTPPTITLTAPAAGAALTTSLPTYSGRAGNATGDSTTVTVNVYSGSAPSGAPLQSLTTTRSGNGNYSVTATAPLPNGTYTARAEQQDTAGNTGFSSANTFTINDTTAPSVTLTQPANSAVVPTATPTYAGAAGHAAGDSATVTTNVYAGSTPTGTPLQTLTSTRDANNNYSVTATSPLPDGTYTAQSAQQDAAGNTGVSTARTFRIDTAAPIVTLTQPASGAALSTTTPTYTGVAGRATGDSATVTVNVYAGATPTGTPVQTLTATRQSNNSYSVTAATALANGTYTAQATQTDTAGNNGLSSANTFTLDTTAPTVTLAQPANGAAVSTATPSFAGVAGSAGGDSSLVQVNVYAGSTPTGTPLQTLSATRQGDNSYLVTATSPLSNGTYTARSTQQDAAGNTGLSTANTFTIDTVAPTVTLTQPANGATLTTATPTYAGVAGNATGDSATVTVKVYAGSSPTGSPLQTLSATRGANNAYSVTATAALAEGTYTAQTTQADTAGNAGVSSANTFTIDTTAPTVTLTQPANGATLSTVTPTYAGVAGNATGDSATVTVKVYSGSTPTGTPLQTLSATRQGDNSYSVTATSALAEGTYTAQTTQTDTAGNSGTSSANTFTINLTDTTPPTVTLTQPADGGTLTTSAPTFAGVAGNATGDSATVTVKVYAGSTPTGTPLQTLSATRQGDNSYSVSAASSLDNGIYTAQATQTDAAGNTGLSSANTFTVNAPDTTPPNVTLTQPANGAAVSTATPTYGGVAGNATGDSATVTVKVYAGTTPTGTPLQTLTAARQGDNSYSVTATSPLANGTYTAQSQQQDAAGNTGLSSANTFAISDATAPTVSLTQPADGATLSTGTLTYAGVAGSAAGDSATVTVKVYAGSTPTGTPLQTLSATRQGDNSYSVTASSSLADGTYTARSEQQDVGGNTGLSSANTFRIDTTAPTVTLTQPANGATLSTGTPTFTGVAGNAAGDSAGVTVKVYAGSTPTGTPLQTLSANRQGDNSYSVSATTLADGTYTAQTTQADSVGNTGVSSANTFTVDATAPTVTLTQPADGSSLSTGTPTYSGAAGSATGDSASVTVKVYAGSTPTGTPLQTLSATRQGDNSYSVTASSPLPNGTYTAQSEQQDAAGNTGHSSANTFTLNVAAPTVTLTQPADGAALTTTTPTYAGVAGNAVGDSPTVTVNVYAGSSPTGTPLQSLVSIRQGDNSYSVAAIVPLADGTYTARAEQQNLGGNTGFSSANTFTIDTTAPTVTLTQPATGATVSTATPTYAGVAGNAAGDSAAVTVKVYAGSSPTGSPLQTLSATRGANNNYSVTATAALAEGTYTAQTTQGDAAGNTGSSSANTFTIDTTAPTVTLTQPANGATLSSATPAFSGVAGNATGDSATVTVKVYAGSTPTGAPLQTLTATRQGDNSYSVNGAALADGTYTAQSTQADSAGNSGTSSASTFTIDTTAPTVTLTQPADGATLSTATPAFAGVAGNAAGDSATVAVKVYAGSTPTGAPLQTLSATRQGNNRYSVNASALADGTYTAQATQTDSVGNTGASSANTFTIDTTAPTVTLTQPADGATLSTVTPAFAGVAGSATGDSATVTVKVYAGSAPTGAPLQTLTATRQGNNSYSVNAAALAEGTYTAQTTQTDAAGNSGTSSANTFTIDTTAPNVTLTQPADGSSLATATPTFAGSAGVAAGDSSLVQVNIYAGSTPTGAPLQTLNAIAQSGSYSVTATSPLAEGTYTARAEQQDADGNVGRSSANTFTIDTTAPNVTLGQPANGATLSTGTPAFAGVAGSATGDSANVTVKVYAGSTPTGAPVQTLTATRQGNNSYSVNAAALAEGTYTAQATQTDAAGNTGTSSANTFAIDTTAPNVTLTQPADGATLATGTPAFAGAAGNAAGDSPTVTVKVYAGSTPTGAPVQTLSATRQADNSYSVNATALADGTYTAQATQADSAGNSGLSSANTFTIDTNAPNVTLTQPANGTTLGTSTPALAGNAGHAAGDSATVTVKVYAGSTPTGTPLQTLSATRQGDNSYSVNAAALTDGTYTAQATQTDAAGNTGTSSANTFTIDTTAPNVTLTQPANGAALSTGLPTYAGVAGNAAGDSATVTVKVYAGSTPTGTPLQTLSASRQGNNSYSVTATSSLTDGTYTAQTTQTDAAGNSGTSSANTFTITLPDTTPPNVTLTQPANGAALSTGLPTYAGVAGNAPGDSATVTVKVYAGSTPTGTPLQTLTATRQGNNSYSVTATSSLTDGTYTAQATQTDAAGNTGTSSANTFTITLPDTTPPNVTLTQPANGAVLTTATPTFGGVAGSAAGDSATVTVKIYPGTSPTGTPVQTLSATRQGDNSYSVASSFLNPGTYTARAEQQDAAGNTGLSTANTFTIRTTVVSLTFNDGIASQYTYARPVLQSHNMNGTFYVASGWISNLGGYMTWGQLDNLYRDGNEIGGMDTDHVNLTQVFNSDWTQDYSYKRQEVCGDHDRLAQMGYDPRSFAYPSAAYNYSFPDGSNVKGIVRNCGYLTGRTVGGLSTTGTAAEAVPPTDSYALRTIGMPNSAVTLATLQNAVTAAVNQGGGWVPIAFNGFCHQGDANYSTCISSGNQPIDDAVFSQFLDWLRNAGQSGGAPAGVSVRTVRQVAGAPPQPTLPPRPTTVSLTFNDGIASQYTYARPVLQGHNMNGTFYVPSAWISNLGGYMSWGQLDNLYRDGDEVGGMNTDHINLTQVFNSDWTQDYSYKRQEVCGDHDRLAQLGYDPRSFAYPFAASNYTFPDGSTVKGIVQNCGYLTGRVVGGLTTNGTTSEPIPPRDAYALRTIGMPNSAVTLATLQNAVIAAANQGGGWVPIAFNNFCHQGDANYSTCINSGNQPIDDAVFSQFLDWLRNAGQPGGAPAGVNVQTVRQVMGAPAQPPLPPRPTVVSLTFDDGHATHYTDARSILSSHGMHGTFFINSGKVGSDSTYMTWPQINDLYADGNEIGGHTSQHVNLTQVDANEATREVCYDRNLLLSHGYPVTDMAYPYGAKNASVESIAQSCGYNSARGAETVAGGCPPTCADLIPPRDPYATKVVASGTDTLSTLESRVTSAEQNGGGWVQIVIHEVCNGCGANAITPATLNSFLDWLQPRAATGTTVKTVQQVIGGSVQPAVPGPSLPPAVGGTNGLTNPSLEQDTNADGIPDCFDTDSWGTQTRTWTRTSDAHTGSFAERVDVSNYSSGANKLNVFQDLGYCAPTVTPGHRYVLTTWYKSTAPVDFVVEKRDTNQLYTFWFESQTFPASSTWTQATLTTPVVPAGINGTTFGLSLAANGSMTVDDIGIVDANP